MFTGIIEAVGRIEAIESVEAGARLRVHAGALAESLHVASSIAVNGCCLTVVALDGQVFSADLSGETLRRTSFGESKAGSRVNLERPLRAGQELGGHFVQGHVDGVGKLIAFERIADSENWWLHIELPDDVEKYTVFKGSISIEGISLTVAKLEKNRCTIAIIPHTVEMTNLHSLKPGDPVNLEADLIAKYVEKMMKGEASENSLTVEDLVQQGF